MKYPILGILIAILMALSVPNIYAKQADLDPFNNDMDLIASVNPMIGNFYKQIPALCKDQFFRVSPFEDFNRFCKKIQYDPIDVYYDHKTCDINFYNDFKKACNTQYLRSDSKFANLTGYCSAEIFDELDDFCNGRSFDFDYQDQLNKINKGGQVFDDNGNLMGHMQYIPYLSKNITDKRFVPVDNYYGYKDTIPGLAYDREIAYDSYSKSYGYTNYGIYQTNPDYSQKIYRNYRQAWQDYDSINYGRHYSNSYQENTRYFNDYYYPFNSGGKDSYSYSSNGCITCAHYGL